MLTSKIAWIIVPGGPGLSRSYLEQSLGDAFSEQHLIYYDPLGAPESLYKDPTLDDMVQQIESVAHQHHLTQYGLITHSFGNYLATQLLKKKTSAVQAMLMLNPMPLTRLLYQQALTALNAKISSTDQEEIQSLSKDIKDGARLFEKLFVYYIGAKKTTLPIEVPLDIEACYRILSSLPDYDDTDFISACSIPLIRIVGECDPFYNEPDILMDRTIVLSEIGHFPFFEDPMMFSKAVQSAMKKL